MSKDALKSALQDLDRCLVKGETGAALALVGNLAEKMGPEEGGKHLGRLLKERLDQFYVAEVYRLANAFSDQFSEALIQRALAFPKAHWQRIKNWRGLLKELHGESQARQVRGLVRHRKLDEAAGLCVNLLKNAEAGSRIPLARQIGAILGSMIADRARAEKTLENVEKQINRLSLGTETAEALQGTFAETQKNVSLSQLEQQEQQWNRMHTEVVVQLIRKLPGAGATGPPSQEEEDRFYLELHAFFCAFFLDAKHLRFADAARVVQEFCPLDPRAVGPVEGVEDVAFLRISENGRIASVRALRRLGEKERLAKALADFSGKSDGGLQKKFLIRLMGGLANGHFRPILEKMLHSGDSKELWGELVDALGRVGDAKSCQLLQKHFQALAKKKPLDPPVVRNLSVVLAALGRIARHPKTPAESRNAIVRFVLEHLPQNSEIKRLALGHLFRVDPEEMELELRLAGARMATHLLWMPDPKTQLDRGNPNQRTELGFREELTDILIALGNPVLPAVLETAETHLMQYCGAFWAVGETLTQIGDPSMTSLVEKMVTVALKTDESALPESRKETFFDAAQENFVALGKDKVVHSLLYALKEKGGETGQAALAEIARQVADRDLPNPGGEAASFLGEMLIQNRDKPKASKSLQDRINSSGSQAPRPRQKDSVKELQKDARGKGLFGVKMEKRISAIQELGARCDLEALPTLCGVLNDKDKMAAKAAETALRHYLKPSRGDNFLRRALFEILEQMREASKPGARAIQEFLARAKPNKDPLNTLLMRTMKTEKDERFKRKIGEIFAIAQNSPAARAGLRDEANPDLGDEEALNEMAQKQQERLQMKRDYLAARRAWIAGGKKTAEPKPPPDLQEEDSPPADE